MKNYILKTFAVCLLAVSFAFTLENTDPWKENQIIKPVDLAATLNDTKAKKPVILNVGPMGNIRSAIALGAANTPEGFEKLKTEAAKINKNDKVVVYCGCCTMSNCPNIREAFKYLQEHGFKNPMVLGIETGFVEDWSGKGYPVQ